MSTLERAIAIAAEAHAGQNDRAGAPYILHPLRVMLSVTSLEERIVAALHDVVEDCAEWSIDRLREEGFSESVLTALDGVTKREGEPYDHFVARSRINPVSRSVKHADLVDNSAEVRLALLPVAERNKLREKYAKALAILGDDVQVLRETASDQLG